MGRMQLAPVAEGLSDFEAKVVTARLGADGILWELRGIVDSLYPLGRIDVLVPVDELEAARQCLLAEQAGPPEQPGAGAGPVGAELPTDVALDPALDPAEARVPAPRRWWVTVAVIAGLVAFSATRVAAAIERVRGEDCSPQAAAEGFTTRCRP